MMEKRYTVEENIGGKCKPAIRVENRERGEYMWRSCKDEALCFGPAAERLYAYEELGYSPEGLKKMIARLKDLEKTPVTQPASDIAGVTCTNLPSHKPNPITKVYNMAQMEQYFTDRNIKVIRKWNKCGTDTRYTFTLTYAGITQNYYFFYPDGDTYDGRSKKMTEFCEDAYSYFDTYVRDNVRVTYMPARQNGKTLTDIKAQLELYKDVGIDNPVINTTLVDKCRKMMQSHTVIDDTYPLAMLADMADEIWRVHVLTPAEARHRRTLNPDNVIFNDPATIVFWNDGSKTVVRAHGGDKFDPEKGLAMAFAKKLFGNNHDYYIQFKRWLKKAKKGPESKKLESK